MDSTITPQPRRAPGEILKDIRRLLAPPGEAMLSQKRLAKALNLSEDYVQRLEVGRQPILLHHVTELALLRPKDEGLARQFDLLLSELRAAVLAAVESKLVIPSTTPDQGSEKANLKAQLDAVDVKIDAVKSTVEDSSTRVETKIDAAESRSDASFRNVDKHLHSVQGKLDRAETKLDGILARQYRSEKRIVRAVWSAATLFSVSCVAVAMILVSCLHGSSENDCSGSVSGKFASRTRLPASAEMGAKKTGEPMPHEPLPYQATGTCRAGETKLFNACWQKAADQSPPCFPGYYSYENACYLPIAADPSVPVGGPNR